MTKRTMLFLSKGLEIIPEMIPLSKKIGFVPTAGGPKNQPHYIIRTRRQLVTWGYDLVDIEIDELEKDEILKLLDKIDVLFVSGGNTFYLLQEILKKDLDTEIIKRVNDGLFYVGESAGAILCCDDISYSKDYDDISKAPELKTTKGLGLFSIPIFPHADHPIHGPVVQKMAKRLKTSISLNEDQALLVEVEDGSESITPLGSMVGLGFKFHFRKYF